MNKPRGRVFIILALGTVPKFVGPYLSSSGIAEHGIGSSPPSMRPKTHPIIAISKLKSANQREAENAWKPGALLKSEICGSDPSIVRSRSPAG